MPIPQTATENQSLPATDVRYLLVKRSGDNAVLAAEQGKWKEALYAWEKIPGKDCAVLNNLGLAYRMTGDPERAVDFLSRALAACPDHPEVRWNYAAELALGKTPRPLYRKSESEAEP
ncbi:MAG: tetratricopeptide repeat protein [Spirochaetia bacterium]|nr:tetratricopeptide repeat protein [Spirochaetia bacterium]